MYGEEKPVNEGSSDLKDRRRKCTQAFVIFYFLNLVVGIWVFAFGTLFLISDYKYKIVLNEYSLCKTTSSFKYSIGQKN